MYTDSDKITEVARALLVLPTKDEREYVEHHSAGRDIDIAVLAVRAMGRRSA